MNEKNLIIILIAIVIILLLGFVSLVYISTPENTTLVINSQDILKDGDNYTVKLTDSKENPIANQNITISFGSNSFNLTTDDNGIAILTINNVPADNYTVEIKYEGNNQYKSTYTSQNVVIEETGHSETRSLDEILQSGEYRKKIGEYKIIEYNYMGSMELALVEDSNGKKWIMGGDGFTSL